MELRRIEDQVRRAIADGQFELHFQPIASITSGQVDVLEALVRWNHPKKGHLAPSVFLPSIERSPIAWTFTHHVLKLAASHVREWIAAGRTSQIAVNVSAHLVEQRLATELTELLAETDVAPRMVILEITESAVMDDPVGATRALDQLAAIGLGGIAIDDFGTGQSSLSRLRDLPIDSLKIDRSFVAELDRGVDPAFVRSVIELGHHLGMRVVAEGVEDEQTWRALAHLGCDAGQGYWLSRPLPANELDIWLAQHDTQRLARLGAIGERRHTSGRRAMDRIAGAFDRAPEAMLISDPRHRWIAINTAARKLLRVRSSAVIERHVDDLAGEAERTELSTLLSALAEQPHLIGTHELNVCEGVGVRVRYELRRSAIPHHHVWVLKRDDDYHEAGRQHPCP